jgi:hypothetical protein
MAITKSLRNKQHFTKQHGILLIFSWLMNAQILAESIGKCHIEEDEGFFFGFENPFYHAEVSISAQNKITSAQCQRTFLITLMTLNATELKT